MRRGLKRSWGNLLGRSEDSTGSPLHEPPHDDTDGAVLARSQRALISAYPPSAFDRPNKFRADPPYGATTSRCQQQNSDAGPL